MEKRNVTGIAYSRDDARISITAIANVPGMSAKVEIELDQTVPAAR